MWQAIQDLTFGLGVAVHPLNLLAGALGVITGTIIGASPRNRGTDSKARMKTSCTASQASLSVPSSCIARRNTATAYLS